MSCLLDNYIDGAAFVGLTVAEIKEIVPPIGVVKQIINLLPKASAVQVFSLIQDMDSTCISMCFPNIWWCLV